MNFLKNAAVFICIGIACLTVSTVAQDITWSWSNLGEFYMYSRFPQGSSQFKGGGDVDTYGNLIYVNRYDGNLDVYEVSIPDGTNENQHPDNPDAPGPVAPRTLKFIKTYKIPQLALPTNGELYATEKGVYFLKRDDTPKTIFYYEFATGNITTICDGTNWVKLHVLGYDDINDVWYGGSAYDFTVKRTVYSFSPTAKSWIKEFSYEDLSGGHFDGMEVIATKEGTKIYLSDMTSDYIGIVTRENDSWKTVTLNKYKDSNAEDVEGMGYGAFNHFWATSHEVLYEIGGGGLAVVVPPETVTVSIPVEQTFSVEEHSPGGTYVGDISITSSSVSKAKMKIINAVPEFEVSSQSLFAITVANGADLDYNTQNVYQLVVVAYTDAGIVTTPDTSIVTIHIIPKTGIADGLNNGILNTVLSFSVKGDNLILKGLSPGAYDLRITNLKGQGILTRVNARDAIVNIASFPVGIYLVSMTSGNKNVLKRIYINR